MSNFHGIYCSKSIKPLNVHYKHHRPSYEHFDRRRHKCPHRRCVRREDVYELLPGFAAIADYLEAVIQLLRFYADKQRYIAFPKKAAGASDFGEFETVAEEGF